ncbi:hypothetical protein [Arthrobacter sp. ISL-72]|uniref:hypothetical protein n=1 Tax=Arthrobacter sp. ISL-72 TaxID=2819114 RepID=UPI001BE860D5|nr:hypothetical protein [Arthrobacter sp. ISL-72]MBT2596216.1 hypothetical protein [Arthrobacter sp. ISL-72]
MKPEDAGEIALHVDGESAIAVGDPAALALLFDRLDIDPAEPVPVGQAMADSAAAVSGLGAVGMTLTGNWFQMTPESLAKFHELSAFNSPINGVFSAALRGGEGRFEAVAKLVQAGGINPASAANVHALAAAMALRMAVKNLEDLVKTLDVKLERVLQDSRTREMGNVQGITHVLSKSYGVFEETGNITATSWDQVTTHATQLSQAHAVALEHIDSLTRRLSVDNFKKQVEGADFASAGELQHWLVLTAVCLANMARMDALEVAHARTHDGASVASHAAVTKRASEERLAKTKESVRALADVAENAGNVDAFNRVTSPFAAARIEKSTAKIQKLLGAFSEAFGMPSITEHMERRAWHESILDLAQEIGDGVVGAATAVTTGVASAPKAIGAAVEDSVLGLAEQIRTRRESELEDAVQEAVVPVAALPPEEASDSEDEGSTQAGRDRKPEDR